ncbi:DUF6252 family protein [Flavobacterium sp. GT3R68]|uniref:DUF6252 family protein n=1 Tax=Flavobacterium sp. GT3R68 TaxID=2594437 RepID=UPI000F86064F|nr:DUF6252 family protein [Flavobacterium sp. GT3R68]RTY91375.1 hypothetical protein EKL32_19295 [Flavobacterium sp. GSN2]TRW94001.1 hypothetical protein FNW07_03560 [Flavobacterium sp. GT3R68]
MKKVISLFVLIILLTSCSEDILTNNPSLQGLRDNLLWRANDVRGYIRADNSLVIVGYFQSEKLILATTSTNSQTYPLGTSDSKKAKFKYSINGQELIYETGIGIGDGEIKISQYDPTNMTVTGTFRFNAEKTTDNPAGDEILNFQEGNFYKVRVYSIDSMPLGTLD